MFYFQTVRRACRVKCTLSLTLTITLALSVSQSVGKSIYNWVADLSWNCTRLTHSTILHTSFQMALDAKSIKEEISDKDVFDGSARRPKGKYQRPIIACRPHSIPRRYLHKCSSSAARHKVKRAQRLMPHISRKTRSRVRSTCGRHARSLDGL